MKKTHKRFLTMVLTCVAIFALMAPAMAYVPYNSYNYNFYGETVASPSGYVPEKIYLSEDFGLSSSFHNLNDIYVSEKNEIYLLDSGGPSSTGRITKLDSQFNLISEMYIFTDIDGSQYTLKNPNGITVDRNDNIYVCDTDNKVALKMNQQGQILLKYLSPSQDVFNESFTYQPYKIGVAKNGAAYIISKGCLDGILEYDDEGTFVRYFGAPKIQPTLADYATMYWRSIYRTFAGSDVDNVFVTYVPIEFENLDIDENGFIFSTVIANESSINEASKLNFTGNNVLDPTTKSTKKISDSLSQNYGDLNILGIEKDNEFSDIIVDDDGFFTLLDKNLSKIFEYDMEGNLIFVYGGDGMQVGTQRAASGIAKLGDKSLVIDQTLCSITVYGLSDYGKAMHDAIVLYDEGLYQDAEPLWREVLRFNANSEIAHIGLGKVYMMTNEHELAMQEFKFANDRGNYSTAFQLYRKEYINQNFGWIATILVVLVILIVLYRKFGKRIIQTIKSRKGGVSNG